MRRERNRPTPLADALHHLADPRARLLVNGRSGRAAVQIPAPSMMRSEEHTSELQSLMRISYAVFCLKKKTKTKPTSKSTYAIHHSHQQTITQPRPAHTTK